MKFTSFTDFIVLFFISSFTLVFATPVNFQSRGALDVFVPAIIEPKSGDVWKVNETRTVVWNTSNPPTNITNSVGRIQLRKGPYTTPLILAENFPILQGSADVVVPNVIIGDDYEVVLFGDSGNYSPAFTISK